MDKSRRDFCWNTLVLLGITGCGGGGGEGGKKDTTPPKIDSFTAEKRIYQPGEQVGFTVNASDNGGIDSNRSYIDATSNGPRLAGLSGSFTPDAQALNTATAHVVDKSGNAAEKTLEYYVLDIPNIEDASTTLRGLGIADNDIHGGPITQSSWVNYIKNGLQANDRAALDQLEASLANAGFDIRNIYFGVTNPAFILYSVGGNIPGANNGLVMRFGISYELETQLNNLAALRIHQFTTSDISTNPNRVYKKDMPVGFTGEATGFNSSINAKSISWGDGSNNTILSLDDFALDANHTYAGEGRFSAKAGVTNEAGATVEETVKVDITRYDGVYQVADTLDEVVVKNSIIGGALRKDVWDNFVLNRLNGAARDELYRLEAQIEAQGDAGNIKGISYASEGGKGYAIFHMNTQLSGYANGDNYLVQELNSEAANAVQLNVTARALNKAELDDYLSRNQSEIEAETGPFRYSDRGINLAGNNADFETVIEYNTSNGNNVQMGFNSTDTNQDAINSFNSQYATPDNPNGEYKGASAAEGDLNIFEWEQKWEGLLAFFKDKTLNPPGEIQPPPPPF